MNWMNWDGRVVLITGAGSGIGQATAREFAALGAKVAILDRDEGAGSETLEDILRAGGEAMFLPTAKIRLRPRSNES